MRLLFLLFIIIITFCHCRTENDSTNETPPSINVTIYNHPLDSLFENNEEYIADGFDYPVGKPDAKGYYDAQPFTENHHLGEDWNAVTGGNSDLGDPIYAIANGRVVEAKDYGGAWGNIIRIVHKLEDYPYPFVESLYAHSKEMLIEEGQFVKKGEQIATIGNCDGIYYAHLHLELRYQVGMPLGGGYSPDTTGFLEPKVFIDKY